MGCYAEFEFDGGSCPTTSAPVHGSYWGGYGQRIGRVSEFVIGPGSGRLVAGTEYKVPDVAEDGVTYRCCGVAASMYYNGSFMHPVSRQSSVWFWLHFCPLGDTYPTNARGGFIVAEVADSPQKTGMGIPDFYFKPGTPWLTDDIWDHPDKLVVDTFTDRTFVGSSVIGWMKRRHPSRSKISVKYYNQGQKTASEVEWVNPEVTFDNNIHVCHISRHSYPLCLATKSKLVYHANGKISHRYTEAAIGEVSNIASGTAKKSASNIDDKAGLNLGFPDGWTYSIGNGAIGSISAGDDYTPALSSNDIGLQYRILDWDVGGHTTYTFVPPDDLLIECDQEDCLSWCSATSILGGVPGVPGNNGLENSHTTLQNNDARRWGQWAFNQGEAAVVGGTVDGDDRLTYRGATTKTNPEVPSHFMGCGTHPGGAHSGIYGLNTDHNISTNALVVFWSGFSASQGPTPFSHAVTVQKKGASKLDGVSLQIDWVGLSLEQFFGFDNNGAINFFSGLAGDLGLMLVSGSGCNVLWQPGKADENVGEVYYGVTIDDGETMEWQGLNWWEKKLVQGVLQDKRYTPKDKVQIVAGGWIGIYEATNGGIQTYAGDKVTPISGRWHNTVFPFYNKGDGRLRAGQTPRGMYIDSSGKERFGTLAVQGQLDKIHPTKEWIKQWFTSGKE